MGAPYLLEDLTYDDAAHLYRVQGVLVPFVTGILNLVPPRSRMLAVMTGSDARRQLLEEARQLGTAVHAACHYHDEGTLNWDTVDPLVRPYLDGWIRFRLESEFDVVGMETFVLHKARGYAGRYDRKGVRRGNKRKVVLDIKTGDPDAADAGPQTAAYVDAELSQQGYWEPIDRVSVQLFDTGTYREHPHMSRDDFEVFKAAHTIFNHVAKKTAA